MAQETTYAKSDFVPGDEIIFDDNFEGERLGEFPLSWDLLDAADEKEVGLAARGIYGGVRPLCGSDEYGE